MPASDTLNLRASEYCVLCKKGNHEDLDFYLDVIAKYVPAHVIDEFITLDDVPEIVMFNLALYTRKKNRNGTYSSKTFSKASDIVTFFCSKNFCAGTIPTSTELRAVLAYVLASKLPDTCVQEYIPEATPHYLCEAGHQICTNCALQYSGPKCPICNNSLDRGSQRALECTDSMARILLDYTCYTEVGSFQISAVSYKLPPDDPMHDSSMQHMPQSGERPKLVRMDSNGPLRKAFMFSFNADENAIVLDFLHTHRLAGTRAVFTEIAFLKKSTESWGSWLNAKFGGEQVQVVSQVQENLQTYHGLQGSQGEPIMGSTYETGDGDDNCLKIQLPDCIVLDTTKDYAKGFVIEIQTQYQRPNGTYDKEILSSITILFVHHDSDTHLEIKNEHVLHWPDFQQA